MSDGLLFKAKGGILKQTLDLRYAMKYSFQITNTIIHYVAEIAELIGQLTASTTSKNPMLRRTNRIRTIHGSLAIEQNTLSLEQVTAVLGGKHVLAPPKDIAEVKNAYEIYERLPQLNPYSIDDLLAAHKIMTRNLVQESGIFRSKPVGVVDQQENILHFGTLPAYVPQLVEELMNWTKNSDLHMLIRSCVFHYEFEVIHPFVDGNGRIGRLWHTLLLSQWNPAFAWLPIESIIYDNQQAYYNAINASNDAVDSTPFIEFMLSVIKSALMEAVQTENSSMNKDLFRWSQIENFLKSHPVILNADVRDLLHVSSSTANRILAQLVAEGKLVKCRQGSHWAYHL